MSIRGIARELYRLQKEVDALAHELQRASLEKQAELKNRLRKATAEKNRMQRILDGRLDR